jgi:3',5'-cyclic AMP phosphodiesterase CpdA
VVKEKPDLVLFGGDQVMNVDGGDRISEAEADAQFANFRRTVLDRLKGIPTAAVIGNHCIWRNTKEKALAAYGMPARYYRREMGGWRILMLDTFHGDRTCRVDEEQMEWLKRELADTKLPVLVLSHAPILTVTSFIEDEVPKAGKFEIPDRWQTANLQALRDLFYEHPNVRLALSGHMHQIDRCDFDRVSYVCGGAVCGNWWDGDFHRFPPAYLVFDLDRDGAFRHRTVFWNAKSRA